MYGGENLQQRLVWGKMDGGKDGQWEACMLHPEGYLTPADSEQPECKYVMLNADPLFIEESINGVRRVLHGTPIATSSSGATFCDLSVFIDYPATSRITTTLPVAWPNPIYAPNFLNIAQAWLGLDSRVKKNTPRQAELEDKQIIQTQNSIKLIEENKVIQLKIQQEKLQQQQMQLLIQQQIQTNMAMWLQKQQADFALWQSQQQQMQAQAQAQAQTRMLEGVFARDPGYKAWLLGLEDSPYKQWMLQRPLDVHELMLKHRAYNAASKAAKTAEELALSDEAENALLAQINADASMAQLLQQEELTTAASSAKKTSAAQAKDSLPDLSEMLASSIEQKSMSRLVNFMHLISSDKKSKIQKLLGPLSLQLCAALFVNPAVRDTVKQVLLEKILTAEPGDLTARELRRINTVIGQKGSKFAGYAKAIKQMLSAQELLEQQQQLEQQAAASASAASEVSSVKKEPEKVKKIKSKKPKKTTESISELEVSTMLFSIAAAKDDASFTQMIDKYLAASESAPESILQVNANGKSILELLVENKKLSGLPSCQDGLLKIRYRFVVELFGQMDTMSKAKKTIIFSAPPFNKFKLLLDQVLSEAKTENDSAEAKQSAQTLFTLIINSLEARASQAKCKSAIEYVVKNDYPSTMIFFLLHHAIQSKRLDNILATDATGRNILHHFAAIKMTKNHPEKQINKVLFYTLIETYSQQLSAKYQQELASGRIDYAAAPYNQLDKKGQTFLELLPPEDMFAFLNRLRDKPSEASSLLGFFTLFSPKLSGSDKSLFTHLISSITQPDMYSSLLQPIVFPMIAKMCAENATNASFIQQFRDLLAIGAPQKLLISLLTSGNTAQYIAYNKFVRSLMRQFHANAAHEAEDIAPQAQIFYNILPAHALLADLCETYSAKNPKKIESILKLAADVDKIPLYDDKRQDNAPSLLQSVMLHVTYGIKPPEKLETALGLIEQMIDTMTPAQIEHISICIGGAGKHDTADCLIDMLGALTAKAIDNFTFPKPEIFTALEKKGCNVLQRICENVDETALLALIKCCSNKPDILAKLRSNIKDDEISDELKQILDEAIPKTRGAPKNI